MSPARRRQMVDRQHPSLSLVRQCALLGVSRSSLYYRAKETSRQDLSLMGEIDRQYLEIPFFGSRRMKAWLERCGVGVSRKRVQRLMRAMGLRAIYRRPSTSRRSPEHPVPLPAEKCQDHPAQPGVGRGHHLPAHGPGIPVPGGYVLAWRLSNTLEAGFCAETMEEALGQDQPEVFNTDQGSQFISLEFTQVLQDRGVRISMDGKGKVSRQHLRGAAVADGEVRGGVPEGLRQRPGSPAGTGRLFPVLQRAQAPSGPGLPDPGRGVLWGACRRGV